MHHVCCNASDECQVQTWLLNSQPTTLPQPKKLNSEQFSDCSFRTPMKTAGTITHIQRLSVPLEMSPYNITTLARGLHTASNRLMMHIRIKSS